jgi:hypothetical protein
MSYSAPDPAQFDGMETAYSYMAPTAAGMIVMPAFTFGGPVAKIAKIVYMNQCNPGQIMQVGAHWLQLAEKYLESAELLKSEVDALTEEDWSGKDRDAFDKKADDVAAQLQTIGAFAMQLGISLMAIGAMLAVLVPMMMAISAALMAMAVTFLALRATPVGPFACPVMRVTVHAVASSILAVLETIDTGIGLAGRTLAGFIGANMTVSWGVLASKGLKVNPIDMVGPMAFNLIQGLTQRALRNAMGKLPGAGTAAFSAGQAAYGVGNSIQGDVAPDAENKMTEAGVDVGFLDFLPDEKMSESMGAGHTDTDYSDWDPKTWDGDRKKPEKEEE